MIKVYTLRNQDDEFLGSFSKREDALKTANFIKYRHLKIYLELWYYNNNLATKYFINRNEIN